MLEQDAVVDAKDEEGESALVRASAGGHAVIVRALLQHHADRGISGTKYGSAFQAASLRGHIDVLQQLLDGADLEAESGQFGTALQAAVLRGHTSIVELLLHKGAEINAPGGAYTMTSKLTRDKVSAHRILNAVEYLVKKQRSIDNPPPRYDSPQTHPEAMVQLLLDRNLDMNIQKGGFGPALHAASLGGHV